MRDDGCGELSSWKRTGSLGSVWSDDSEACRWQSLEAMVVMMLALGLDTSRVEVGCDEGGGGGGVSDWLFGQ